jgi:hypothetical protein
MDNTPFHKNHETQQTIENVGHMNIVKLYKLLMYFIKFNSIAFASILLNNDVNP